MSRRLDRIKPDKALLDTTISSLLKYEITMQTFMPEPSMYLSLMRLDYRRLGKQRVEARQVYNALQNETSGWRNHPAVQMWRGYEEALKLYHDLAIEIWTSKGYRNTMKMFNSALLLQGHIKAEQSVFRPQWMFDTNFLNSHRSNLLRKNPEHYGQFDWEVPNNLPYIWPGASLDQKGV